MLLNLIKKEPLKMHLLMVMTVGVEIMDIMEIMLLLGTTKLD